MIFEDDPELTLLVRLLRNSMAGKTAEDSLWSSVFSKSYFLKLVRRHRVAAFLASRADTASLPSSTQNSLADMSAANAVKALLRTRTLIELGKRLENANIPFLSVKGPMLAQRLYGDVGGRHAGDLDFLIDSEHVAAADGLMRESGCRRSSPNFDLSPRQWREYQIIRHEFQYFNQEGIRIEFGWRLAGLTGTQFDELYAAHRESQFGGISIPRLPATTELLHLFVHGAGHGWFRLFWLLDIALLLRRDHDWEALMREARRTRTEHCVWQGARLAETIFGVELPASIRPPENRQGVVDWLVNDAIRQLRADEKHHSTPISLLRDALYLLRLRPDRTARAALVRPRLCSPENWQRFPLPDQFFSLYYPAAPFLWSWRRIWRADDP
ncbi:MAG: hypothetical protein ACI9OD_000142 [Limisphaerales bacterium]|jgi:hypothetical protein